MVTKKKKKKVHKAKRYIGTDKSGPQKAFWHVSPSPGTFSQQRIEALQISSVWWRNSLILYCCEDVQGVIEENSGVEGACKVTSQADPGNACLYIYQARD